MVASQFTKYINFTPISEKAILLQLNDDHFVINILQLYAPTSEKKYDDEMEKLSALLNRTLKSLKNNQITIIMGVFNAKTGQSRRTDIIGKFGLGNSNERGDRRYEFCQDAEMTVTNTRFKLLEHRLYT